MRTRNSIVNAGISIVLSVLSIAVGFIAQRIFIHVLGLEYLGVNGLFMNILAMLGIVELGFGPAMISHLYRPIAEGDKPRIRALMGFYKKGYRIIALIVTTIGVAIVPFLGTIVGSRVVPDNIYVIYLLFLTATVSSYLLSYKRSILFASQKNYIVNLVQIFGVTIMNGLQIAILILTKDYYLYLLVSILTQIGENIVISAIVQRQYKFLNSGVVPALDKAIKTDITQKIKGLFFHKIAEFVVFGSDNIVISVFLGIKLVGLYSNYNLVLVAIGNVVGPIFSGIMASIGDLLVAGSPEVLFDVYKKARFLNIWVSVVSATGFLVAMDPFVTIWLGRRFVLPLGVLLALSVNLYLYLTRSVFSSFRGAAGIFYQDRFIPIVEAVVNLVFSIVFLYLFGLAGVFMGTILSNLVLHLVSYPKYVYTKLFRRSYKEYYIEYFSQVGLAFFIGLVAFYLSRLNLGNGVLIQFVADIAIGVLVPSAILYILYRRSSEYVYFKELVIEAAGKLNGRFLKG